MSSNLPNSLNYVSKNDSIEIMFGTGNVMPLVFKQPDITVHITELQKVH